MLSQGGGERKTYSNAHTNTAAYLYRTGQSEGYEIMMKDDHRRAQVGVAKNNLIIREHVQQQ